MPEPDTPRSSFALRDEVHQLSHGCCEYCLSQAQYSPSPFSIEHIIPRVNGGSNEVSNLAIRMYGV